MTDDFIFISTLLGNISMTDNSTMANASSYNNYTTPSLISRAQEMHAVSKTKKVCNGEQRSVLDSLMQGYDRTALPFNQTIRTGVELTIQDVNSISENDASVMIDLWYSQIWNDQRLVYKHMNKTCREYLSFDSLVFAQLWTPAVCIANSKKVDVHTSPLQNTLLLLFDNGTVWLNNRMQVRAPCEINLRNFPLDIQSCEIVLESYPYSNEEVEVDWLPESQVTVAHGMDSIKLPDFKFFDLKFLKTSAKYTAGDWDQLYVKFYFKRLYGYYILQGFMQNFFKFQTIHNKYKLPKPYCNNKIMINNESATI